MCGIICVVGKYRYKEIPKALIERGRDDNGIYEDEYVQLIQTRLEITKCDVQLPYQDDRYVLLFNGEVYNWAEFGGANEYESILKGVRKYGKDLGKYLDGQFYIIVYDKHNQKFFSFQDQFKIHVVYHTNYKGSDIHASNLRSLPQIEFNEIQHQGFGNITTAAVL
jgi:asparagine synthase (glutamine-hydrolysing)